MQNQREWKQRLNSFTDLFKCFVKLTYQTGIRRFYKSEPNSWWV